MTSKKERNIMNTVQKCLFGGALLGAGLSNTAMADIHIEDTLEFTIIDGGYDGYGSYSSSYAYGSLEIHRFDFTVLSDGNVQFDMLSYEVFNAFVDTQIIIFNNDGNPLSNGNRVDGNDDHFAPDFNGSINGLDSFLDVFLTAGEYTIAVGSVFFSANDAEVGVNFASVFSNSSQTAAQAGGQYELDIIGNVASTVPAPGALALLGLGGLAATRRRR